MHQEHPRGRRREERSALEGTEPRRRNMWSGTGPNVGTQGQNESSFDFKTFSNLSTLRKDVQQHLVAVYSLLAASLLSASVGVYAHLTVQLGGFLTTVANIVCVVWLLSMYNLPDNFRQRLSLFLGASFFQGCTIGLLVEHVLVFHPSVLLTAFLGTSAIFACFTASALVSPRRSYLYLGGFLGSALSTMAMLRLGSMFLGGYNPMFQVELYLGLLVMAGYVLFDTQLIVEKATYGVKDPLVDSLKLYSDFVSMFVRLLIILSRNSETRGRDKGNRRNARQAN